MLELGCGCVYTYKRKEHLQGNKEDVCCCGCALGGCSIGVLMRMDEGEERKRCW